MNTATTKSNQHMSMLEYTSNQYIMHIHLSISMIICLHNYMKTFIKLDCIHNFDICGPTPILWNWANYRKMVHHRHKT